MKHLILGTAGHVDHGKTTLIKALTNIDCDTHKEEKRRGITINLGFSYIDLTPEISFGIIDVPGHKDFINTMVSGASSIDMVLLVIAADSGIMPQTKEHLNIIETLGIEHGVVAITKTDLVDDELQEIAMLEISELLEDSRIKDADIVGVSSTTGKGLDDLRTALAKTADKIKQKTTSNLFRLYIDRLFNVKGLGTVVTGSVLSGKITNGDELFLSPGNQKLKIKGIERHGKSTDEVIAGDRAAINLSGLKAEGFKKGMLLTNQEIEPSEMIDAWISLFPESTKIKTWSNVIFQCNTIECQARMHILDTDLLEPGDNAIVQIHLEAPVIVMNNDRFILRNTSTDLTLGGGITMDTKPLHHKRRKPELIDNLKFLAESILNNDLSGLIKIELDKQKHPQNISQLAKNLAVTLEEIKAHIDNALFINYTDNEDNILISLDADQYYYNTIIKIIKDYHKNNKILPGGVEKNEFYGKLGFSKNKTAKRYIDLLMEKLKTDNKIVSYKNTWIIADHKVILDDTAETDLKFLEKIMLEYEMQKPVMTDIEETAHERKISKEKLKMYLKYMVQNNILYYNENEYVHSNVVDKCRSIIIQTLTEKSAGINISEFRQILQATKKICPLLIRIYESEKLIKTTPVESSLHIELIKSGK